ncbi:MAG TPA: hypothetical protein EYP58_03275 [bacterium (Candidatus Stahlbacteria)]|nr:hypothetical protein [Candidatus Stahlbacteria bacterium]
MKWLPKFTFVIALISVILAVVGKVILGQGNLLGLTTSAYLRFTDTMLLFTIAIYLLLKER